MLNYGGYPNVREFIYASMADICWSENVLPPKLFFVFALIFFGFVLIIVYAFLYFAVANQKMKMMLFTTG